MGSAFVVDSDISIIVQVEGGRVVSPVYETFRLYQDVVFIRILYAKIFIETIYMFSG